MTPTDPEYPQKGFGRERDESGQSGRENRTGGRISERGFGRESGTQRTR